MSQRVRFAAAASGAAALAYVLYREIRHLATRPQKLEALGRVGARFPAANLDRMVRCDPKRLRRMLRALLLGAAPERISDERGLAFDDWDLDFYTKLFRDEMKRNPTDVECFDMAQSNSEHSRHWFFGGRMVIDGEEKGETLFRMVKDTITKAKVAKAGDGAGNSIIAFHDNSSVIRGYPIKRLCPQWNQSLNDASARPAPEGGDASRIGPAPLVESKQDFMHPLLTAETHNFPTGVAPFPGATTGTGGRLRDVQATGTGAHTVAGTAAYCVGNLNIPGHDLPWEDKVRFVLFFHHFDQ